MDIAISIIRMIGGLVLLLYGMELLSTNLKKIAGEKLEKILKKATNNTFKGILTGIIITIALQSSSATTVMVVGFVNAGILKLKNSIPIIMGANIGTTVTAQILRMANVEDNGIFSLISPSTLAPIFLLIGLLLISSKRKQKTRSLGQLLVGIGLIFTGLMTMVEMANVFTTLPILPEIISKLSNPILGVIVGALITALVQSSAATIGILQALSTTGITTYACALPIILGQNIGTCFTSILSSIGASKNAKRTAAVHLYFNLIGTIIFLVAIYGYQGIVGFSFWNNPIDMGGIANFHLIFNIVSTIILLPAIGVLEKITLMTIRDKKEVNEDDDNEYLYVLNKLDDRIANIPSVAINNSLDVIIKMGELSGKNLKRSVKLLEKFNVKTFEKTHEREDNIDKMDIKVANYLVALGSKELNESESRTVNTLLKIESDYEKVADYAYSIAKYAEFMNERELQFSQVADKEIKIIYNMSSCMIDKTLKALIYRKDTMAITEIEALRKVSDRFREKYKQEHIERLKEGKCSVDNGIAFIEVLASFEKIGNHCLNIATECLNIMNNKEYITKSEYIDLLYLNNEELLKKQIDEYTLDYEKMELDNKLKLC